MKHLLLILLTIVSVSAKSQISQAGWDKGTKFFRSMRPSIVDDAVNEDGFRRIYCNVGTISQKNDVICFAVSGFKRDSDQYCRLNFVYSKAERKPTVSIGDPILLKLGNDSTYRLNIVHVQEFLPQVKHIGSTVYTLYSILFSCELTENEIEAFQHGTKKFRFEINDDKWDIEPKKDTFSQFVIDEYNLIQEAFTVEKKFEDDF